MKIKTFATLLLFGTAMMVSAQLWDGRAESCRITSSQTSSVTIEDGRAVFRAEIKPKKHQYFQFNMAVTPFRMADQALALKIHNRKLRDGHCFYIRGLNKDKKIVVSFYSYAPLTKETEVILVAGKDFSDFQWFADSIQDTTDDEIVEFSFYHHCNVEADLEVAISDPKLIPMPKVPKMIEKKDYGIAVKGGTSRGMYAMADEQGKEYLLVWLMDGSNKRNLLIDIETGDTKVIPVPDGGDAVFASILGSNGKCYTEFNHRFYEFDVTKQDFTAVFKCHPHQDAMWMAEGPDGVIWAATYPDAGLVSFNPKTREFNDYGSINRENWAQYPRSIIAAEDGWVYVGIGSTRGQVVAFNPATREIRALVPEELRPNPSSFRVRKFTDGKVYGVSAHITYRLENGVATKATVPQGAQPIWIIGGDQGCSHRFFPSGRKLKSIDVPGCKLEIEEKDGKVRKVNFNYENYGVGMMGLDVTEDGIVGGGGFFPFRFGTLNPETGEKTDVPCEVQCNTIIAKGKYLYIGSYTGGQMLRFDPTKPWALKGIHSLKEQRMDTNPRFYGQLGSVVNRPHCIAVSPDDKYFVVGGTPGYGRTGGGLGILDLETNELTIVDHTKLAPNESPVSLTITADNQAIIGTTTSPGTGGEKLATSTSIMIFDLATKKLLWKDLFSESGQPLAGLYALPSGVVLCTAGGDLFTFDPKTKTFGEKKPVRQYGNYIGAQGMRIFTSDGDKVYIMLQGGVGLIDQTTYDIAEFYRVPSTIMTAGAVHNGVFYYLSSFHWTSAELKKVELQ